MNFFYVLGIAERIILPVGTSSRKLLSWETTRRVEGQVCRYLSSQMMACTHQTSVRLFLLTFQENKYLFLHHVFTSMS